MRVYLRSVSYRWLNWFGSRVLRVFTRLFERRRRPSQVFDRASGALLPESFRISLRDQPGQSQQVVRGATEDEQPVNLLQSTQLDLT